MSRRLYCTPRAMWKLSWFLRDFGYDPMLGKSEIEDKALVDLWGVVKVSEVTFMAFQSQLRWLCAGSPVGRAFGSDRQRF